MRSLTRIQTSLMLTQHMWLAVYPVQQIVRNLACQAIAD